MDLMGLMKNFELLRVWNAGLKYQEGKKKFE